MTESVCHILNGPWNISFSPDTMISRKWMLFNKILIFFSLNSILTKIRNRLNKLCLLLSQQIVFRYFNQNSKFASKQKNEGQTGYVGWHQGVYSYANFIGIHFFAILGTHRKTFGCETTFFNLFEEKCYCT